MYLIKYEIYKILYHVYPTKGNYEINQIYMLYKLNLLFLKRITQNNYTIYSL